MLHNLYSPEGLLLCGNVKQANYVTKLFGLFGKGHGPSGQAFKAYRGARAGAVTNSMFDSMQHGAAPSAALLSKFKQYPDLWKEFNNAHALRAAGKVSEGTNALRAVAEAAAARPTSWPRRLSTLGRYGAVAVPAYMLGEGNGYGNGLAEGTSAGTSSGLSYAYGRLAKTMTDMSPMDKFLFGVEAAMNDAALVDRLRNETFNDKTKLRFSQNAFNSGAGANPSSGFAESVVHLQNDIRSRIASGDNGFAKAPFLVRQFSSEEPSSFNW